MAEIPFARCDLGKLAREKPKKKMGYRLGCMKFQIRSKTRDDASEFPTLEAGQTETEAEAPLVCRL